MSKITFIRNITDEDLLLEIAKINGYTEIITKDKTVINKNPDWTDYNIIEKEETPNPVSPAQYMADKYQATIDEAINKDTLSINRIELEKTRKVEDEAIKKATKEQVGDTETIVS